MTHTRTLLILLFSIVLTGCATKYPNRSPQGEVFPPVTGTALTKEVKNLPDDLPQENVLLLLGYVQNAQFDIDRWLIGLDMTKTNVAVYELPTIQGMFPRMFQTQIDNGMRKGIPKEIWGGVITIYEDGETIQRMTGNQDPNNARVLLLNQAREIVWFYDRGFSVAALNDVRSRL